MIYLVLIYYFQVGIVRLKQPENLGPGHEETRYIIMVLCPSKEKEGLRYFFFNSNLGFKIHLPRDLNMIMIFNQIILSRLLGNKISHRN